MVGRVQQFNHARQDLAAYSAAMYPKFELPSHLRILVQVLERVQRGELDRVIICMPPRHGKSMTTSQLFPAWYLGRNPSKSIIASSYGQELASDFGRRVRNFASERLHRQIFPECVIADDSDSVHRFHTTAGRAYYAVGAGGPLTGRGADLLLIDDPIKSADDARSPVFRRSLQDWYESTAYTRLEPAGAVVLIQTRWHEADLAGWLLREHASEGWKVISLPAIGETNEGWRNEGDPLWCERFPLETLARIREAIGTASWSALYQQRPVSEEGGIFKRQWWREYAGAVECHRTIFSLDTAFKAGLSNDFSVVAIVSEAKDGYYIRHVSRGRWEFPELKRQAVALAEIWRPNGVLIEDAASGQSLIQALRAETRLPILPVRPMGDKVSRAHAVSPLIESGRVFVPAEASWLADFLDEMTSFPAAPHDDMVDAITQALNYLRGEGRGEYAFTSLSECAAPVGASVLGRRERESRADDLRADQARFARQRQRAKHSRWAY
ncbi:phage terminase large subunit [Candidatus Binatus sp.]|uniref:phage terminase large subunit n=1 Tax=Candidatus Binatus sp. TaxID=2811406 RepID=UPI003C5A1A87